MSENNAISEHWGKGDVYAQIISALEGVGKNLDTLTIEELGPVDHYHVRGFPATVELGDQLPIMSGQHILDIGCGLGGPARYLAHRFACKVSGVDITTAFVDAANKLTSLLKMNDRVVIQRGDGNQLPYDDSVFDGGITLHVTMNVSDRPQFFAEAFRVLKPGAFFAMTEHGLGPAGSPYYPLPWSEDGSGAFLVTPEDTEAFLEGAGFADVKVEDTGEGYLAGYRKAFDLATQGALPPLGTHLLMGDSAPAKIRNAAHNIEERRTHPIKVLCRKPE
jgi:SAM-dependent methyltransferase